MAVYFNNNRKYINTLCKQNTKPVNVEVGDAYIQHCGLKGSDKMLLQN
jgi:hypothetical protein